MPSPSNVSTSNESLEARAQAATIQLSPTLTSVAAKYGITAAKEPAQACDLLIKLFKAEGESVFDPDNPADVILLATAKTALGLAQQSPNAEP